MSKQIKLLWELQELDITLSEVRIVHKQDINTDSIRKKIEQLRELISANYQSRYDRLIKQGIAVVQELNGMCMGCNLVIPVGDLNRIKNEKTDPVCPNCGKFVLVAGALETADFDAEVCAAV